MKQLFSLLIATHCLFACTTVYPVAPQVVAVQTDVLQPGDLIHVIVYGEESLSGHYTLDHHGAVTLPLVGRTIVSGKTVDQAATLIAKQLQQDYLHDPHVAVALDRQRDVYVLGEVQKPGNYTYEPNLTVLQAIAKAGGYSYRASHKAMILGRTNGTISNTVTRYQATEDTLLLPGDSITVQERYF